MREEEYTMKVLILNAGQGRRLLPLTAENPKCMLPVVGRPIIEWQIDTLIETTGIDRVTVVVGYRAETVAQRLMLRYKSRRIRFIYNRAYDKTDNLVSCWLAREEMTEDFILLNGDTLFEPAVVQRLIESPPQAVTLVIDHKASYDAEDMKVTLDGDRLIEIGKDLAQENSSGESIGMILFRNEGPVLFRQALEQSVSDPASREKSYPSVIREMCRTTPVFTCSVHGLRWYDVDYPADLKAAGRFFRQRAAAREPSSV